MSRHRWVAVVHAIAGISRCGSLGVGLLVAAGCQPHGHPRLEQARRVHAVLDDQVAAWNRGDVDAFMAHYWQDPGLTFSSGGQTTRGWQATLDRYHRRYPDRAAMGRLTFDELEVVPMGPRWSRVLGRWHLDRDTPIGGRFTLIMQLRGTAWVIVHDHTSVDERSP